jgi:hypothetical protein
MSILSTPLPTDIFSVNLPTVSKTPGKAPRKAPTCTVRVVHKPGGELPGHIQICVGKSFVEYTLERFDVPGDEWGAMAQGFKLTKCVPDPERTEAEPHYNVLLSRQGHVCDCPGFESWGHCKHVSALEAAHDANLL